MWLKRGDASLLARIDRETGGQPKLTVTAYRMCTVCGRARLGEDAEHRLKLDRQMTGRQLACDEDCLDVARQLKKGKRGA